MVKILYLLLTKTSDLLLIRSNELRCISVIQHVITRAEYKLGLVDILLSASGSVDLVLSPYLVLFLALLPCHHELSGFSPSYPSVHHVSALEQVHHGLNPLEMWVKLNLSSYEFWVWGAIASTGKQLLWSTWLETLDSNPTTK